MNSFSLYRYQDDKPCLKLTLEISEERISWLIPKTDPLRKNVKRLAIETSNSGKSEETKNLLLIDKGDIEVKCLRKRKIIFKPVQTKLYVSEFVLLVPGWGTRTKNKMWVLIPHLK